LVIIAWHELLLNSCSVPFRDAGCTEMFAQKQESGQIVVFLFNTGAQKFRETVILTHFNEAIFSNAPRIKDRRK